MTSIDFPKANVAIAKDQPGYQTLFAYVDKRDPKQEFAATCCLQLSTEELEELNRNGGKLFFTQITFGRGFSPIRMSVVSPFTQAESFSDSKPMDENRTPTSKWDQTHYRDGHTHGVHHEESHCLNCGKSSEEHYWSTRQCEL